ncbi:MAG: hypothetical protein IK117_06040 [Bacteroidales bacterium]|nr:hypothetical protein [Bacteroidales bacterium]
MKAFKFNIEGKSYDVAIENAKNGVVDIQVNGKNFTVEIEKEKPKVTPPAPAPRPQLIEPKAPSAGKPTIPSGDQPHTIMKIYVTSGQEVKKGDKLFTMESDGKECDITADKDGIVEKINVAVGKHLPSEGTSIEMKASGKTSSSHNFSTENATPAPLPGTIVQIMKPEGSPVQAGELVLTMDSMKMVNNVVADKSGTITHILVAERQAVLEGDPLFIIE